MLKSKIKLLLSEGELRSTHFFNSKIRCKVFDNIFPILTHFGDAPVVVSACLLIMWLGDSLLEHAGYEALLSVVFSHLIVQVLKKSICRDRPRHISNLVNDFKMPLDYSFPSGHTTAVFSIALSLLISVPFYGFISLPIALTIGISRIYLGVHYISDVVAGIFIAFIMCVTVHYTLIHQYLNYF